MIANANNSQSSQILNTALQQTAYNQANNYRNNYRTSSLGDGQ